MDSWLQSLPHVDYKTYDCSYKDARITGRPQQCRRFEKQAHYEINICGAEKNPDKKFIFVIDAVNQLHHSMGAWLMWWLPGKEDKVPLNVRFIVSTLIEENNTYQNALKRCPSVKPITVSDMSKEDREVMVREKLGKFCKKLSNTFRVYPE